MALASYFLVVFEDERDDVRRAGRTYLIATHLGTAALLVLFLLLGQSTGSLDFADLGPGAASLTLLFALALVGFGTKAGFVPLHIWLPEAHPAAPSHVSALMSGVMIKTGIYGLLRILHLPRPAAGVRGAGRCRRSAWSRRVGGVLLALAQHDLKRLLAYSSVENIGIIALGLASACSGTPTTCPDGRVSVSPAPCCTSSTTRSSRACSSSRPARWSTARGTRDLDQLGGLLQAHAVDRRALLDRRRRHLRPAAAERLVGELLIYLGALRGRHRARRRGRPGRHRGGHRPRPRRRPRRGVLRQGLRHRVPRRAAEPPRPPARTRPSRWLTAPMVILAAVCVALGLSPRRCC